MRTRLLLLFATLVLAGSGCSASVAVSDDAVDAMPVGTHAEFDLRHEGGPAWSFSTPPRSSAECSDTRTADGGYLCVIRTSEETVPRAYVLLYPADADPGFVYWLNGTPKQYGTVSGTLHRGMTIRETELFGPLEGLPRDTYGNTHADTVIVSDLTSEPFAAAFVRLSDWNDDTWSQFISTFEIHSS